MIYGLIDHHEVRNVATPDWLIGLPLLSRFGAVSTPYATLDGDTLMRHPPLGYPHWPFREQLAMVTLLERAYNTWRGAQRPPQKRTVTERLLLEMDALCRTHEANLLVALLGFESADSKTAYASFLDEHGVAFVDCAFPPTRDMQVPGEGHPNGRMNSRWADCIGAEIERRRWVVRP